jgi:hypothetical protein
MIDFILVAVAFILGLLRLHGHKSLLFQGIAHVFVGGLLGAGIKDWVLNRLPWRVALSRRDMILGLGLTVLEVICFVYGKLHS